MSVPPAVAGHRWTFFRAGGFDQVRIATGADLVHLDTLDQKLWVALSCPTQGLHFDARALAVIDSDGDGRIRAPELLAAVRWALDLVRNPDDLVAPQAALPLAAIDSGSPRGAAWLAAARRILALQGRADATAVTLEDASDAAALFAATALNGDGVVPPEAAPDADTRAAIEAILATVGSAPDRSGRPGVTQALVDTFFTAAEELHAWLRRGEDDPAILCLGPDTAAAGAALTAVRAKIDDAFARARLAAFDPRAADALHPDEKHYQALAARDLSVAPVELRDLPLARVLPGQGLPLGLAINPAWTREIDAFVRLVVRPLLGEREVLTEAEWRTLQERLAPWQAWQAAKAGAAVEALGIDRIGALRTGPARQAIAGLIAADLALDAEHQAIASVEKLLLLHRNLHVLLKNFVSFEDFFSAGRKGIFQAGTLFLDQRSCELCLWVDDVGSHAAMAGASHTHLAYCSLQRRGTGEKASIVAAFTGGDADFLAVGRNGLFYDRKGKDWDATIVRLVENPVSIRQAVWSPYKKILRLIEQQVAKFAAAREKSVEEGAATRVGKAGEGLEKQVALEAKPADAPRKEPFDVAKFAGIFAAIGLAIGAIGGAIGAMVGAFAQLAWWQMPLALFGILLAISGPSVLIAWLKLRQRNLAPLLDPSGWAINARAHINIPFGGSLTQVAALPRGVQRDLVDPFRQQSQPLAWWAATVAVGVVLAWFFGVFEAALPGKLPRSPYVAAQAAPDSPEAAPGAKLASPAAPPK